MKATMEHFTNPIADFFKSTNKAVIYIEFSIFGSLLVFVAVFLYFFYFKSKKIEPEEEHHKEKNQEKILPIKTEKKSTKSINKYLDLHLHLDGAITKEIAIKLAKIQNIELPTNNEEELENLLSVRPDCESVNDFLKCFALPLSLMQTPLGLSEAIKLVANNIQSHGVIYAEFRFAPQLHKKGGMTQEQAVRAALEGIKKTSLKVNLILCFMRGDDNQAENEETLRLARKYLVPDGGVVAVDLAGAEAIYKTANYRDLFRRVREYGIPFTIHAGEADGPQSVRDAISFGAKRIGHGVRAFEDPEVVELIRERGITLEMCPTSNKQTCALKNMADFPLINFLNKGIKVTLNTDDMGISRTNIIEEYNYIETNFGLNYEQKKTMILNSINSAFTTGPIKRQLLSKFGF